MTTSRSALGTVVGIFAAGLIFGLSLCEMQGQTLRTIPTQQIQITSQPLEASSVPSWGNFYLLSQSAQAMPPLPVNPFAAMNLNVYALGSNNFAVDDSSLDNASRAMSAGRMSTMDSSGPPSPGDGGWSTNSYDNYTYKPPDYGTNLFLLITNISDGHVYVILTNTVAGEVYQVDEQDRAGRGIMGHRDDGARGDQSGAGNRCDAGQDGLVVSLGKDMG